MSGARPSAPPRTDPLAAALAFAIREAVRLAAEQGALPSRPTRATVVVVNTQPQVKVA